MQRLAALSRHFFGYAVSKILRRLGIQAPRESLDESEQVASLPLTTFIGCNPRTRHRRNEIRRIRPIAASQRQKQLECELLSSVHAHTTECLTGLFRYGSVPRRNWFLAVELG